MFRLPISLYLCALVLLTELTSTSASAQRYDRRDMTVSESTLRRDVSFLSHDLCQGRASGTEGGTMARQYISGRFRSLGLAPINWHYTQSFRLNDTLILRNVVGIIHSSRPSREYVVICAHYDHLGIIKGKIYNGADDNASGVAALLSIAEAFTIKKNSGAEIPCNYLFAALDGKEQSLSGSRYLAGHLGIAPENIKCAVNIDILGSDLVPLQSGRKEYLIALGESSLPSRHRGYIGALCAPHRYDLDLDLSFYGSREFTRLMLESGDHKPFIDKKIPTVFFTSGFHSHTYKTTDDEQIVNFPLLRRRTMVIFNFAEFIGSE